LCIKAFEYNHKFEEGALPGKWFHFEEMKGMPGANMFFTVYFLATGLHAFHVIVGMAILIWVTARLVSPRLSEIAVTRTVTSVAAANSLQQRARPR
jgi:cytochrome c oxidase subunit 3